MKTKLTILLLIFSLSIKASDFGNVVITALFVGTPVIIGYAHFWYDDFNEGDGLYVSPSLDAKMFSEGLLDFKARTIIKIDRWQPYLAYEVFGDEIDLEAWTVGCDYRIIDRKMWLNAGIETGCMYNQGVYTWTSAIGAEVGIVTKYGFSVSYKGDFQTRSELVGVPEDVRIFGSVIKYNGRVSIILPVKTNKK